MKTKFFFVIVTMLFVKNIWGMDVFDFFKRMPGNVRSVSVTSTNMAVNFNESSVLHVELSRDPYVFRHSREYARKNEPLILVPDKETALVHRHGSIYFKPVTFKSKHKGFRIINEVDNRSVGREMTTNIIVYLALSDTPVQVGEDDVEMIMENGEWKAYEKPQSAPNEEGGATTPPPRREPVQPAAVATPPEPPAVPTPEPVEAQVPVLEDGAPDVTAAEDGQAEKPGAPSRLWFYALIPLVLSAAALYFIRRRHKI